ncbi:MAG: pyridoxamine 5'-phosphate oxidase family protein [bacterium]
MSTLKERIGQIIGQMQLSALATVTAEGKPWVRYVMTVADEKMNIRFSSFVGARKVEQLKRNPEVHLTCGVTNPMEMKPYLQIQGRARFTTDRDERHGFWNEMMANIYEGPDDPKYGIIIVEPYRIEYCAPGKFEPEVWTQETGKA